MLTTSVTGSIAELLEAHKQQERQSKGSIRYTTFNPHQENHYITVHRGSIKSFRLQLSYIQMDSLLADTHHQNYLVTRKNTGNS